MKLTNQEIVDLNNGLHNVGKLNGAKFAYAVSKNINILKPEIEAMREAFRFKEDFLAYEKERAKLAENHSAKKKGEPQKKIVSGTPRYVIKNEKKFDKILKSLKKKHKKAIDARQKQLDEFSELMKEKVEIELHKVLFKNIPEAITAEQMTAIFVIVDEKLSN